MAAVAAAQGDAERCVRLRGLVERLMNERHHYRRENLNWEYAPHIAKARAVLGDDAYDAAFAEGRAMMSEQALAYGASPRIGVVFPVVTKH